MNFTTQNRLNGNVVLMRKYEAIKSYSVLKLVNLKLCNSRQKRKMTIVIEKKILTKIFLIIYRVSVKEYSIKELNNSLLSRKIIYALHYFYSEYLYGMHKTH